MKEKINSSHKMQLRDTLTNRLSGDGASFEALDNNNTVSTIKKDSQLDHRLKCFKKMLEIRRNCKNCTFLKYSVTPFSSTSRRGHRGGALRKRPTLPHPILAPHPHLSKTIRRRLLVVVIGKKIAMKSERPTYLPNFFLRGALKRFRVLRARINP